MKRKKKRKPNLSTYIPRGFMFGLGAGEMLIIVAFALIFIGPKKLPELARNLGKGFREFQKAKDDFMHHVETEKSELDLQISDVDDEQEDHDPKLTGVSEPHDTPQEKEINASHAEVSEEEIKSEAAAMEEAINKSARKNSQEKDS